MYEEYAVEYSSERYRFGSLVLSNRRCMMGMEPIFRTKVIRSWRPARARKDVKGFVILPR